MEIIKLLMVRENLDNILDYSLPNGYHFEYYKKGDMNAWVDIEVSALEFENEEKAVERFTSEFMDKEDELQERCLFIVDTESNKKIATIMAWMGTLHDHKEGRIHWVSILPEYQGQGLSKPLLTRALNELKKWHHSVYLTTTTKNYKAINLYLSYGFEPYLETAEHIIGWKRIEELLNKNIFE